MAKYNDYTYKMALVINSLICDSAIILLISIELIWSIIAKRIVTYMSDPHFCDNNTEYMAPVCGFFRPYYLQFTGSYLTQTFVSVLILSLFDCSQLPGDILVLTVLTFVIFGINVIITIISCFVIIE